MSLGPLRQALRAAGPVLLDCGPQPLRDLFRMQSVNTTFLAVLSSIDWLSDGHWLDLIWPIAAISMVPMNLVGTGMTADYIDSGSWAEKAAKEAAKVGTVNIAATTKGENYSRVPSSSEMRRLTR